MAFNKKRALLGKNRLSSDFLLLEDVTRFLEISSLRYKLKIQKYPFNRSTKHRFEIKLIFQNRTSKFFNFMLKSFWSIFFPCYK